jgi:hypothetical protein
MKTKRCPKSKGVSAWEWPVAPEPWLPAQGLHDLEPKVSAMKKQRRNL